MRGEWEWGGWWKRREREVGFCQGGNGLRERERKADKQVWTPGRFRTDLPLRVCLSLFFLFLLLLFFLMTCLLASTERWRGRNYTPKYPIDVFMYFLGFLGEAWDCKNWEVLLFFFFFVHSAWIAFYIEIFFFEWECDCVWCGTMFDLVLLPQRKDFFLSHFHDWVFIFFRNWDAVQIVCFPWLHGRNKRRQNGMLGKWCSIDRIKNEREDSPVFWGEKGIGALFDECGRSEIIDIEKRWRWWRRWWQCRWRWWWGECWHCRLC